MSEATELTQRYGAKTAVDALSLTVRPGRVTGFPGPDGAGGTAGGPGAWPSLALVTGYTALAPAGAALVLRRRDV